MTSTRFILFVLMFGLPSLYLPSVWAEADQPESDFYPRDILLGMPHGKEIIDLSNMSLNEPEKAKKLLQQTFNIGTTDFTEYHFAYLYLTNVNIYQALGDTDKVKQQVINLFALADEHNADWIRGVALLVQANQASHAGELERGSQLALDAINIGKAERFPFLVAAATDTLATNQAIQGDSALALTNHLSALKHYESRELTNYMTKSYSSISSLYLHRRDKTLALRYNQLAMESFDKQDVRGIRQNAVHHINRAVILSDLELYEQEFKMLDVAQRLSMESGDSRLISAVLANYSDHYLRLKDFPTSIIKANECLQNEIKTPDSYVSIVCRLNLGLSLVQTGQEQRGMETLKDALKVIEKDNIYTLKVDAFKMLYEAHFTVEKYREALDWHKKYFELHKQQVENDKNEQFLELQAQFQSETKEKEIEYLTSERQLAEALLEQKNLTSSLWFIIAILTLVVLIYVIGRYVYLSNKNKLLNTSNTELLAQSHLDHLTGLYNRRFIEFEITTSHKNDLFPFCTLLMLDIDFFKKINDTYGHDVGDEVLVEVAKRFNKVTRGSDLLARWGGEEFVLIIHHNTAEQSAFIIQRLLAIINSTPIEVTGADRTQEVDVTVSIGFGQYNGREHLKNTWEKALKSADNALYQAKKEGRNRACSSDASTSAQIEAD